MKKEQYALMSKMGAFKRKFYLHCADKSKGIIINHDYPYIYYNLSCIRQVLVSFNNLIVSK